MKYFETYEISYVTHRFFVFERAYDIFLSAVAFEYGRQEKSNFLNFINVVLRFHLSVINEIRNKDGNRIKIKFTILRRTPTDVTSYCTHSLEQYFPTNAVKYKSRFLKRENRIPQFLRYWIVIYHQLNISWCEYHTITRLSLSNLYRWRIHQNHSYFSFL